MSDVWELVGEATRRFEVAGVPSPRFDAEELAAHVLGTTRGRLRSAAAFDADQAAAYAAAVDRRVGREPLQHIIGTAPFRYLEVAVGPGVFTPRPETELVAGWAIERATEIAAAGRSPLVVDLCSGSGAIALALAHEVPTARVHAVELSADALVWTHRNAEGTRVVVHEADALTALPELDGLVDVVTANPPYIPADGLIRDPEVLAHEPPMALWGTGPDGLDLVRGVALTAARLLRQGGFFVVEHADVQGASVVALLAQQAGWVDIAGHRDLAGRDRFATAVRKDPDEPPV